MIDYSKLPLSITSFSEFCERDKIYIDKTDLVAKLAQFDAPIFYPVRADLVNRH